MKACQTCGSKWSEVGVETVREAKQKDKVGTRTDYKCAKCGCRRVPVEIDDDLLEKSVKLAKNNQMLQDTNRIERKAFREYARQENSFTKFVEGIDETLKLLGEKIQFSGVTRPSITEQSSKTEEVGFVQLSDLHLNEIINLAHNYYDIDVANKRLMKFANEIYMCFRMRGIRNVVIGLTGDLMNSDRREDERLNQAMNRAKAAVMSADLLAKFILDLASRFNITVISTPGNEGRVDKDFSFSNDIASNNYDFTIVAMIKQMFQYGNVPVQWGPIDKYESIIEICGQKVMLTHDVNRASSKQKDSQSLIGRMYLSGTPIDCAFTGHIHATRNSYLVYRSASLPGSNEFNEIGLGLFGNASQNYAVFGNGYRHVTAVDLQNVDGIDGYNINALLMEYNAKSSRKLSGMNEQTILKIVC